MAVLSSTPNLVHCAIVSIDPYNPVASTTVLQYNPSELTRSLKPQTNATDENRSEPMRLKGPPIEMIQFKAEIDATDQLNNGNSLAKNYGIYPQLSALEMMIYPKSAQVMTNTTLLAAGTLEILPDIAPTTLFIWGANRVLPVRISDFNIIEQAYDANLNPIRAEVSLGLRVLSYDDLSSTDPNYYVFLNYQIMKETLATLNTLNGTST